MNILIVANHYCVASARYATAAFERLGHTVKHVGPAMGRSIWGLTLPPEYVWEPDGIGKVERDFAADLYVVMDSDPAILDSMKPEPPEYTNPVVVWGVDNHVRDYRRPYFEHYFLAHRHVSVMAWEADKGNYVTVPIEHQTENDPKYARVWQNSQRADMTHVPCAYDPTLHTPSPIPFEEREYDVCMIGVMYPARWNAVHALRDAGYKVLAGTGLVYEAYRDAYQNSRISLCLSSNGDVAQRVLETARMGCVIISDDCPDYPILKPNGIYLLEPGETYTDAVKAVLHEPEHAQAMVAQSMAWAEPYSWDNGARKVVEWYERR